MLPKSLIVTFFCITSYTFCFTRSEKESIRNKIREMSLYNIKYGQIWTPPNSKENIRMDCSGTVQYIYKTLFGIQLPRSSYEQYLHVKNLGNFRPPPKTEEGKIDSIALRKQLRTGDLLFWTNTHTDIPKDRNPPISHVMIYIGRNPEGIMKAGGANTFGRGERVLRGGVDIYTFDPNQKMGCVKDSKGNCVKNSEFFGFGSPLKK